MPLKCGYSQKTVSSNIKEMVKSGHTQKSAVAAALKKGRECWRKKHSTGAYPAHLKTVRKKKAITAKSQITRKPPSSRLRKRRAKNNQPGYFPNPLAGKYVGYIKSEGKKYYYVAFDSHRGIPVFDTDIRKAAIFSGSRIARSEPAYHIKSVMTKETAANMLPVYAEQIKKNLKTNPVPLSKTAKIKHAIELYESFSGQAAQYIDTMNVLIPDVALRVGFLDGVLYTTIRDGKKEKYIHKFKAKSRPLLLSSFDGKNLIMIGGSYQFTDRGIIDK